MAGRPRSSHAQPHLGIRVSVHDQAISALKRGSPFIEHSPKLSFDDGSLSVDGDADLGSGSTI